MHIHILGACGTFMGGLAALAVKAGHTVSGSDEHTYPPMSTQLEAQGIKLFEGYHAADLQPHPDLVIIGNALSRGNEAVEYVLNAGIPYASGPRWLGENYLAGKTVLAVAGTHGKTTTSSLLAWILEFAGLNPGFLIGGVPANFGISARDGDKYFVVEADEYDTAFFDKRSKFVHYRPRIAVLNNLEFDHADIFPDLEAIKTQFHHFVRTIPGEGTIISNAEEENLEDVLVRGCWSKLQRFGLGHNPDWFVEMLSPGGRHLRFSYADNEIAELHWQMNGRHNAMNACAAIAAANAVGIPPEQAIAALAEFKGVARRMELKGEVHGVKVFDDFAHHPTAIRLTLEGMRRQAGNGRILVAMEPRSNTMRSGVHSNDLGPAFTAADWVWLKTDNDIDWNPVSVILKAGAEGGVVTDVDTLLSRILDEVRSGDLVIFMSNGGFNAAPQRFVDALNQLESL
ncbi:MAG: UDP-N-acetylmuramate:L-alanyl-gamma-D-glutamyl-meso-diaminopimelate ligase [Xanthomonadales bacterium]|nr:UDP-N-acetylmuramate:L-alanyl-gamma-D-glutamyl-meso-diaminopimelate ligase [Xanthomonadales bacterium]